jgi:hypothetical protein
MLVLTLMLTAVGVAAVSCESEGEGLVCFIMAGLLASHI